MEVSDVSYRIIADLLAARTGQQLSQGRSWRIGTALSGLFRERGISNVDQLVCLLASPGETKLAQDVVEALLNNETYFFRDRLMYDVLEENVLPDLAKKRAATKKLSIWSAGCSTGQEALSLAMMFKARPDLWANWHIEITATDISQRAIEAAKKSKYSQFEIQRGLGVQQMLEHFEETPSGWVAKDHLQSMIRYQTHNLFEPMPGRSPQFDLILCRNVLLYFDRTRRGQVFDRLHSAMAKDGWLMLGAGETTLGQTDVFTSSKLNSCLHRSTESVPVARGNLRRA